MKDTEVRDSPIQGRGVFALRDFKKDEVIGLFKGPKVSIAVLAQEYENGSGRVSCDAFQIGRRVYMRIGRPYVDMNHSCEPNVGFKNISTLVALCNIQKGEELCYDYSATEWTPPEYTQYDHEDWPLHCACGTSSCRKLAACFPLLPKKARDTYLKRGVLQNHIKRMMRLPVSARHCAVCENKLANHQLR